MPDDLAERMKRSEDASTDAIYRLQQAAEACRKATEAMMAWKESAGHPLVRQLANAQHLVDHVQQHLLAVFSSYPNSPPSRIVSLVRLQAEYDQLMRRISWMRPALETITIGSADPRDIAHRALEHAAAELLRLPDEERTGPSAS